MGQSDRKKFRFGFLFGARFGVTDISLLTIRAELPASVEKSRARGPRTNVVCKSQAADSLGPLRGDDFGSMVLHIALHTSAVRGCEIAPQVPCRALNSPARRYLRHRHDRARQVDLRATKTIKSDSTAVPLSRTGRHAGSLMIDHGDQTMTSPTSKLRARLKLCAALGMAAIMLVGASIMVEAQVVEGVQKGAREGNKAAGPVGGVLGGAIGGVVGVVTGVTGVLTGGGQQQQPAAGKDAKQGDAAKSGKAAKGTKTAAKQPQVLTQTGAPQITAEQIVTNSDANIERIKKSLDLTPEQEKNWAGFNSAMHYLGHNGADRLNLRIARAKRDPPDDIIEQMRNEAQFLNDRAVDQRNVADAAEPLFASLDAKQKAIFIQEMVNLSHERGLD
jgi:hypothetical protein